MKTSNNFKMRNGITVSSLMISSLLLLGSCQKDELAAPSADKTADNGTTVNSRPGLPIVPPEPVRVLEFEMIKIDHNAARTFQPEYSVTVRSDGTVLYEGRRNVAVRGRVAFKIRSATVDYINELCKNVNFYSIIINQPELADLPYVSTSYLGRNSGNEGRIKTLVDYNNGSPRLLVAFRMKIESNLNLIELIGHAIPPIDDFPDEH